MLITYSRLCTFTKTFQSGWTHHPLKKIDKETEAGIILSKTELEWLHWGCLILIGFEFRLEP